MPDLRLRSMTDAEFAVYAEQTVAAHADASVSSGRWPADDALARAAAHFAALLPAGTATEGMILLTAEDDLGVPIGSLWLGLRHPGDLPGAGYLWDITVDPARRGLGFGRSLLVAGEDLLRQHGVTTVALNVFGDNETARRLYATNGYRTVSQLLHKAL